MAEAHRRTVHQCVDALERKGIGEVALAELNWWGQERAIASRSDQGDWPSRRKAPRDGGAQEARGADQQDSVAHLEARSAIPCISWRYQICVPVPSRGRHPSATEATWTVTRVMSWGTLGPSPAANNLGEQV